MAASNLPVRQIHTQHERRYDGNMLESLFAIVDRAETLSASTAPEFDPEDDIELEIRTRSAGVLAVDEVLDRVNRRAS
jgi:hypothetical protein